MLLRVRAPRSASDITRCLLIWHYAIDMPPPLMSFSFLHYIDVIIIDEEMMTLITTPLLPYDVMPAAADCCLRQRIIVFAAFAVARLRCAASVVIAHAAMMPLSLIYTAWLQQCQQASWLRDACRYATMMALLSAAYLRRYADADATPYAAAMLSLPS